MAARSQAAPVAIASAVQPYLAELRIRAAPGTVRQAERSIAALLSDLSIRNVSDVTLASVAAWRAARVAQGASHRTANLDAGTLKTALQHAVRMGVLPANPLAGLRALPTTAKHRRRVARALSDAEAARVLAASRRDDADNPRRAPQTPLLHALLSTGARWGELVGLKWRHVDIPDKCLHLQAETTKTQSARVVPLTDALADDLKRLQATSAPGDHVFLAPRGRPHQRDGRNFRRWLDTILIAAGVPRELGRHVVHIHALRHTFATRCARHEVPVHVTQAILGHASPVMTLRVYTHVQAGETKRAVDRLPPIE